MAKAVQALQAKKVNRIILTRPAVEAGERLGFLPGTLSEKIDPYLRPLYDALHDMLDPETIPKLLAAGTIEVAPLAYMRGRTLNDAFIILDEAQNTSPEQMKMFLTRLGFGSKIVVTGDVTQVDLPSGIKSGLRVVEEILDGVEDLSFNRLTAHDVVRHRLVGKIVAAYEEFDAQQRDRAAGAMNHPTSARALHRGDPDEHRGAQRVRGRVRRAPDPAALQVRAGPDAGAPARRAVRHRRRRGHHRRAQREVDGQGRPDRRAGLPDGRAAARAWSTRSPRRASSATSCCARPSPREQARTAGHSTDRRARPAHRARHPAPPRLRPRRAGGAQGDVRPPGPAAGGVGRPRGRPRRHANGA